MERIQRLSHKLKKHRKKKITDRLPHILSSKKEITDEIRALPRFEHLSKIDDKQVKPKYFRDSKGKYKFSKETSDFSDTSSTVTASQQQQLPCNCQCQY